MELEGNPKVELSLACPFSTSLSYTTEVELISSFSQSVVYLICKGGNLMLLKNDSVLMGHLCSVLTRRRRQCVTMTFYYLVVCHVKPFVFNIHLSRCHSSML